jgi:menaquinone-9 beta-reductase
MDGKTDFDVIIVGGGLSGLTAAILLSAKNKNVLLIEKKSYPFHKVCGEYVSNEVLQFLQSQGFNPFQHNASRITKLRISTPGGKNIHTTLDLGGFGLSRFTMDNALYSIALKNGAQVLTSTRVDDISLAENSFFVKTNSGKTFTAKMVIGSYGKRDVLDKKLNRDFIKAHTGYMGVKYHLKTDYPVNEIGLDNFENGYCGIVKIEDDKYNLCYLYRRTGQAHFNTVRELEERVLFKNPVIRKIFADADFISEQPEVINEISFAPKQLIENHIIMCGDAAGLITPLCGNGMSMAIHAAKLLCDLILQSNFLSHSMIPEKERTLIENNYKKIWNHHFSSRLFWGRTIQNLFGKSAVTSLGINCIHAIPPLEKYLLGKTHGSVVI